jgi:hypothetical protein
MYCIKRYRSNITDRTLWGLFWLDPDDKLLYLQLNRSNYPDAKTQLERAKRWEIEPYKTIPFIDNKWDVYEII